MRKINSMFSNMHEVASEETKNMPSEIKRIDILSF
jgi:hypothetical protein